MHTFLRFYSFKHLKRTDKCLVFWWAISNFEGMLTGKTIKNWDSSSPRIQIFPNKKGGWLRHPINHQQDGWNMLKPYRYTYINHGMFTTYQLVYRISQPSTVGPVYIVQDRLSDRGDPKTAPRVGIHQKGSPIILFGFRRPVCGNHTTNIPPPMCCCLTLAPILVQIPTNQVSETVQTEKQNRLVQEYGTSRENSQIHSHQWEFQDPKMEVTVPYKAIFCGDIPLHSPYFSVSYMVGTSILGCWNSNWSHVQLP